jgi:hypothetical protein
VEERLKGGEREREREREREWEWEGEERRDEGGRERGGRSTPVPPWS